MCLSYSELRPLSSRHCDCKMPVTCRDKCLPT
nr:MAG TPA: hypothetical protein [Caudoviricetes sp.]